MTAAAGPGARQRIYLDALGIVPLRLRRASGGCEAAGAGAGMTRAATGVRLVLRGQEGGAPTLAHPRVAAVLRALGLEPSEVAPTPLADVPELILPDEQALASAVVKRALWPALRRLRRQLREATGGT